MKLLVGNHHYVVELTRRNLETLLAKLDDPSSARTLIKESDTGLDVVWVRAVENDTHYSDRDPGPVLIDGKLQ